MPIILVSLAGLFCRKVFRLLGGMLCAATLGWAEPVTPTVPLDSFVRITDDEGLAHSDVRAIAQDHEGFMWFGLRLAGLTRYDGYELKVHQHDPLNPRTIGSRVIWSLLVDGSGALWIGTEGGLDRYDRETDSFIHHRHNPARADSLPNDVVTAVFEDSRGQIWAATRNGICRLDDRERGSFTTFRRTQVVKGSAATNTYRAIMEDVSTGLFWLGSSEGLVAFDPRTGAFMTFLHDAANPESLSNNAVNKVVRDPDGIFWALTESGLNTFTPSIERVEQTAVMSSELKFRRFIQPADSAKPGVNFVRDGLVDRKNRFWLGTRDGVRLFDRESGSFIAYRRRPVDPTSLSDDLTQAVFEDQSGNLWIGTYAGGVNRLRSDEKPFRTDRHDPGNPRTVSENRIAGLGFDPAGRLWAATVNGLNRRDDEGWTRFLHDAADAASLPSNDLATLAVAPSGDVWMGTNYGGLYRYDGKRFHEYPTSPSSAPRLNGSYAETGFQINSILPDAQGNAWIGARAYGLDYFSGGRFQHYNPQAAADGIPAQPANNALLGVIDPDGALWFATETSGLGRFDPRSQSFTTYLPPVFPANATRSLLCLAAGRDGLIWLGAADGLLAFDTKTRRFVHDYSTTEGLPHAAVMTIVPDRRGHLWLGTANGLADFDPVTEKFRAYDKADGLPTNVFSQRTGALGPDGRVYLGTRAGIVSFLPEELRENPIPPRVVVTELRWLGARPDRAGSYREAVLNIDKTIRVPPGQLGFSLRFSALDFAAPEKNRYRYCLEGWEEDWTPANARERLATYTALPPGTYTFRVQASNADLVWNNDGASVDIVVAPRVWQTAWFRIALGLAIAASIAAGLNWRLRTVRTRNAHLERQVMQRTAQLREEVRVRKEAEAALRESHAELESRVQTRTAELARSNVNLQTEIAERKNVEDQLRQSQKMEVVGQLAGGIAHDFNNLLTVILGQSELLNDTGMPAQERAAALHDIIAAARRATNLTRQLLVFSRNQAMNPVATDLNLVISNVSKLLRHVIGEHIEFETALTDDSPGVFADPGMLEQVLLNMAVNARDAMPRGGRLVIASARVSVQTEAVKHRPGAAPGDYARFSVSDTGEGIPEKIRARIFEPFFTTKEAGKGTGLGLAISHGIVQQHRGWIEVESTPGAGTTFHVYLPLNDAGTTSRAPTQPPFSYLPGDTTILLAEDESSVRNVVQHVLTRQGYRVIACSSGVDAQTRWAAHREDVTLLLTDIVMPGGLDGHALAAMLMKEKPSLRVITMSGYDPGEFAGRGDPQRIHLRKPFTTDDLLKAVDRTLRS